MKITAIGIFHPNIGHSYQPLTAPAAGALGAKLKSRVHPIGLAIFALLATGQQINPSDSFLYNAHAWQELSWKQSIRRLYVPPKLKPDLIETVVELMREDGFEDDFENGRLSDDQLRDIAAEARIALVDLAGHPA